MATCTACGREAPAGALLCEHDGTPLGEEEAAAPASHELLAPGTLVGEYRIVELLGEGGFGAVYRAEHPVIGKAAAVKVVKRELGQSPEMTRRFVAEARAVNQIRHKNIIDIFNFGTLEDGRQYYVMELLDGATLDALLDARGRLSFEEAQPILRQLARALAAAHAAGIAHRDLKPENVFVAFDDDGAPVAKLLDFGLAKLLGERAGLHRTRSGVPMGTPLYMSPEQVYGKDVDHRTDVYSFGIMVFRMLTGELPFLGDSVMEVMVAQTSAARPAASSVAPDLPSALDEPIRRMMAIDPAERPASIQEAADALFDAAREAGLHVSGGVGAGGAASSLVPSGGAAARKAAASGRPSGRSSGRSSGARPGSAGSAPATSTSGLAHEDTIADPRHRLTEPRRGGPRPLTLVLSAALLGGLAFVAQRRLAATPEVGSVPSPLVSASAPSPTSVPPEAATPPSAAGAPSPVSPVVRVTVRSAEGAEVFRGDARLGAAGEALELPRGGAAVLLEVRKSGYEARSVTVEPTEDREVDVELTPIPTARPGGPSPRPPAVPPAGSPAGAPAGPRTAAPPPAAPPPAAPPPAKPEVEF